MENLKNIKRMEKIIEKRENDLINIKELSQFIKYIENEKIKNNIILIMEDIEFLIKHLKTISNEDYKYNKVFRHSSLYYFSNNLYAPQSDNKIHDDKIKSFNKQNTIILNHLNNLKNELYYFKTNYNEEIEKNTILEKLEVEKIKKKETFKI